MSDSNLKSFVFTLNNPHNVQPRRFALKERMAHEAIGCDSECGPCFGDIHVSDNCNANAESFTSSGWSYINDTGVGASFLTGSQNFQVKEIEVFEITD
jgi:hypothetical protein